MVIDSLQAKLIGWIINGFRIGLNFLKSFCRFSFVKQDLDNNSKLFYVLDNVGSWNSIGRMINSILSFYIYSILQKIKITAPLPSILQTVGKPEAKDG